MTASPRPPARVYCGGNTAPGLTCAPGQLALLRRLTEDHGPEARQVQRLYQCQACGGLYKFVHISTLEGRNFDSEAGWHVLVEGYFKVGEPAVGRSPFPVREAETYGYPRSEAGGA